MKNQLNYNLIAVFSIFAGSQITEGVLLVPYWQSMSSSEFYSYYQEFGPAINRFYTVLTIVALLIPIALAIYYYSIRSAGFKYALISCALAILFVSCFYIYFNGTNQAFYQSAFNEVDLKNELVTWASWHWGRVVLECLSLYFLILAVSKKN
ncbi:hypothetical protein [Reichenbachiella sp.]